MKNDGHLWIIICVLSLRVVVAMPATFRPRIDIMQKESKRKEMAAPCLSNPFDGAWIPEWQLLTGQIILVKGMTPSIAFRSGIA